VRSTLGRNSFDEAATARARSSAVSAAFATTDMLNVAYLVIGAALLL
jgi:hypothetical protein